MRSRRRCVPVALVGLVLALATGPIARAQYGEDRGSGGTGLFDTNGSPITTIQAGGTIVVECTAPPCADDGADVDVSMSSATVALGSMKADSNGDYSGRFTIPSNTSAGRHTIIVETTLDGDPVFYSRSITVTTAAVTALPKTGRDIALLVVWGVLLMATGTLLVRGSARLLRRMRTSHEPHAREADERPAPAASRR